MRLRAMELVSKIPHFNSERQELGEFVAEWRQLHYLAQCVAEVGKSWGEPQDDDSHSALFADGSFKAITVDDNIHALLELESGAIEILNLRETGAERLTIWTSGLTLDEVKSRVRRAVEGYLGPERQPAVPAPDLPDHPVAAGKVFEFHPGTDPRSAISELYANTQELLGRFVGRVVQLDSAGSHELQPRIWPHHFDLASLLVAERDGKGNMAKTIGVGLTPPDDLEPSGYWYVSPWSKDHLPGEFATPELPVGRWIDRGKTAMAILPVDEVWSILHDPDSSADGRSMEQTVALAEFVAMAFNACMRGLGK